MTEPITSSHIPSVSAPDLGLAWKKMRHDGYLIANDELLGLPSQFRHRFHEQYFTADVLRCYPGDIPADRERARDVIRYAWESTDEVLLSGHDVISIPDRHGRLGPREFDRVELVHDGEFAAWTAGVLSLVPPEARLAKGTLGVNLFRTRTQVVTGPHQDHERYIVVYVVDKIGTGAETSLHDVRDADHVVHRTTLRPGEFVIFDDSRFKHSASRLVDPSGGDARRDVLVCTVNYADTYPLD